MSDMSPPLHDLSVTPISPQPNSFAYTWDFDQHCKSQENEPKTIPAQTNHIYKLLRRKKNKKNKVKVQM